MSSFALVKIPVVSAQPLSVSLVLSVPERDRLTELEQVVERGLDAFLDVARALLEIRNGRLYRETHTTFESYVNERFGLARRSAYGYIEAATVSEHVPPETHLSLSHLRLLAPLAPDERRQFAGEISEMTVAQARRVIREWRRQQRASHNDIPEPPPFPTGTYRTICADVPWRFDTGGADFGDGLAADCYPTMSLEEICSLPIGDLAAPDSHLYLWVPATKIPDGMKVMDAYGFRFVALLTWVKPSGGLGRWWRYATEYVAFGVKGKLMTRPNLTNVIHAKRTGHSRKPDEFYDLVEQASPGPYVDLFARRQRAGWTCWGNQVPLEPVAAEVADVESR